MPDTASMTPDSACALERARAALLKGRVRIIDPDRIADDSMSVMLLNDAAVIVDETTGLRMGLNAAQAETIAQALAACAVQLRAQARRREAAQARGDALYLQL